MGSRYQPPSSDARLELADRAWVARALAHAAIGGLDKTA